MYEIRWVTDNSRVIFVLFVYFCLKNWKSQCFIFFDMGMSEEQVHRYLFCRWTEFESMLYSFSSTAVTNYQKLGVLNITRTYYVTAPEASTPKLVSLGSNPGVGWAGTFCEPQRKSTQCFFWLLVASSFPLLLSTSHCVSIYITTLPSALLCVRSPHTSSCVSIYKIHLWPIYINQYNLPSWRSLR